MMGSVAVEDRFAVRRLAIALSIFCVALITTYHRTLEAGVTEVVPIALERSSDWQHDRQAWLRAWQRADPGTSLETALFWSLVSQNDQRFVTWGIARNAWTLLNRPRRFFDAERCFPGRNSLALGEPMVTVGLLGVPG